MPKEGGAKAKTKSKQVRVYVEAGVTLCVSEDPPQYLKYTFGQERLAASDDAKSIAKAEALAFESCEAMIEKRTKKLSHLIRRVSSQGS